MADSVHLCADSCLACLHWPATKGGSKLRAQLLKRLVAEALDNGWGKGANQNPKRSYVFGFAILDTFDIVTRPVAPALTPL